MKKEIDMHNDLSALNRREKRQDCVKRLLAEISNKKTKDRVLDSIIYRQDRYGLRDLEMAEVLGMSKSHYSQFLSGELQLPKKAIIRALIIGVPLVVFSEYLDAASLVK